MMMALFPRNVYSCFIIISLCNSLVLKATVNHLRKAFFWWLTSALSKQHKKKKKHCALLYTQCTLSCTAHVALTVRHKKEGTWNAKVQGEGKWHQWGVAEVTWEVTFSLNFVLYVGSAQVSQTHCSSLLTFLSCIAYILLNRLVPLEVNEDIKHIHTA